MKITNWRVAQQPDTIEVSAEVDGFRLWYRLPKSYSISIAGDPFLAAALLPAMLKGKPLEIDPQLARLAEIAQQPVSSSGDSQLLESCIQSHSHSCYVQGCRHA